MITIHEMLTIKRFNNFRLIAGANGLNRIVTKGGFLDHETVQNVRDDTFQSEMIFSSLPMIKDQPEIIVEYVKALIDAGTAGFAIKTVFFNQFPEEAIQVANEANYPLFLFDDTYIEYLILDIDELVNTDKRHAKKLEILELIRDGQLNSYDVLEKSRHVNPKFKAYIRSYTVNRQTNMRFDIATARKILGRDGFIGQNRSYIYLITSSNEMTPIDHHLLEHLGICGSAYRVGVSNLMPLEALDESLRQSLDAVWYSDFKGLDICEYEVLGIYKLLMPMMYQRASIAFYTGIIKSLTDYDEDHKSELLKTATAYVQADGDIKYTSELLFQHVNTVRYRIRKIREILALDDLKGMAYETLAVAIHLHQLNQHPW